MDELDLPRLEMFENYYGRHPPLHIMVANYLGLKPGQQVVKSTSETDSEVSAEDFSKLLEHLPLSEPEPYMTTEEYLAKKAEINVE